MSHTPFTKWRWGGGEVWETWDCEIVINFFLSSFMICCLLDRLKARGPRFDLRRHDRKRRVTGLKLKHRHYSKFYDRLSNSLNSFCPDCVQSGAIGWVQWNNKKKSGDNVRRVPGLNSIRMFSCCSRTPTVWGHRCSTFISVSHLVSIIILKKPQDI